MSKDMAERIKQLSNELIVIQEKINTLRNEEQEKLHSCKPICLRTDEDECPEDIIRDFETAASLIDDVIESLLFNTKVASADNAGNEE